MLRAVWIKSPSDFIASLRTLANGVEHRLLNPRREIEDF
jgi:hypothetical protein